MDGTCEFAGCTLDARWIRVSQYAAGAALYICDQHWNLVKLRDAHDAECYAGLPNRARMRHEVPKTSRLFALPSKDLL